MKKIIFLYCLLCAIFTARAEKKPVLNSSDTNIIGHVIDKETKEHLPGINIFLKNTTVGTFTDKTGHFFIKNAPTGDFTIVMKAIGYQTIEKEITLRKGTTVEVNFEAEEDMIVLNTVVVSANRNETARQLAPALVSVLDMNTFDRANACSLAEGLSFQPGVRVENNCQNCGFQQVRINGLEGPYTQILIDSRPIFSALTGVYGLEQIPANMVQRVEIMRGGGSAMFGSSAIAGTINIITKEPLSNSAQLTHSTMLIGGDRPDHSTTMNASLVTDNHKAGLYIFGQNRTRSTYDHDKDGFSELGELIGKTVGFRSFIKTTDYSKLTFEYHNINEFRRGGSISDLPPHETDITEQTEHYINGGGLKFDLFSKNFKHRMNIYTSAQHIKRKSYYGAGKDPNAYGHTTGLTYIAGAQYALSMDKLLFMPSEFTAGTEYTYDELEDKMMGYNRHLEQDIHIGSFFLQNEWKNDRWSFLLGGRADKHNLMDHLIFSPRVNLRYNPNKDINIRFSYAAGFRAPQAFDEDLHITAVGGEALITTIAPDLQEERSNSFSSSIDIYRNFGEVQANFLVDAFYTGLDNVFVLESVGHDDEGNLIMERHNGEGATVMGVNLEAKAAYEQLQLQAGATIQRSRYKEAEQWSENKNIAPQKKMFRSPDVYGYFTGSFNISKEFAVSLTGTYTGPMLVQHFAGYIPEDKEETTPDFFDINAKLAYDIPIQNSLVLQLNGGVQNIFNSYQNDFDKGAERDAGYIYGPTAPRSYYMGCKITY